MEGDSGPLPCFPLQPFSLRDYIETVSSESEIECSRSLLGMGGGRGWSRGKEEGMGGGDGRGCAFCRGRM